MNVFRKVKDVKELLRKEFPKITDGEINSIIQKFANWQYKPMKIKRKVKFSERERQVQKILLENKYNFSTIYRWFLLADSPSEIRDRIRFNEISLRNASKEKNKMKKDAGTSHIEFKHDVVDRIERYILR